MSADPSCRPAGRRAPRDPLGALIVGCLCAAVLSACGISVGEGDGATELFTQLTVEGDFVPGGRLLMTLQYEQPYPVNIAVSCILLDLDRDTSTPTPQRPPPTPDPAAEPTQVPIPRPRPTPVNKVLDIIQREIPANPQATAIEQATPVPDAFSVEFRAPDAPGRYRVRCFTPADPNNAIAADLRIAAP